MHFFILLYIVFFFSDCIVARILFSFARVSHHFYTCCSISAEYLSCSSTLSSVTSSNLLLISNYAKVYFISEDELFSSSKQVYWTIFESVRERHVNINSLA